MPKETPEEMNPNDIILILFDYLTVHGITPKDVCIKSGVSFDLFDKQNDKVTVKQEEAIWQEAFEQSNDPNFGLHFGMNFHEHVKGHILFALISNSPTMAVALRKIVSYHALLHGKKRMVLKLEERKSFVSCQYEYIGATPTLTRVFVESFFSGIMSLTRYLSKSTIVPEQINFKHQAPVDPSEHQSLLKAPICFNQSNNELIFSKESLSHPIPMANSDFLIMLEDHIKKLMRNKSSMNVWTSKVTALFRDSILSEPMTIRAIAKELTMSPRTLQGKLKMEGQSFSQIRDQVRKEIAIEYLKGSDEGICEIAFLLGFSEQSTFTKAFKQWTGLPPLQYRKKFGQT